MKKHLSDDLEIIVTAIVRGARKSAAPVGNTVGKAHEMYPSVLNSFMGVEP